MHCPLTDAEEDALGDLLGLAEFTDGQRIGPGRIEVDDHHSTVGYRNFCMINVP